MPRRLQTDHADTLTRFSCDTYVLFFERTALLRRQTVARLREIKQAPAVQSDIDPNSTSAQASQMHAARHRRSQITTPLLGLADPKEAVQGMSTAT
jgi:hypothetical protein